MSVCLVRARCAARRGGRGLTSPFILYGTANGVLGDPRFVRSNGTCAVGVWVGSGAAWSGKDPISQMRREGAGEVEGVCQLATIT